MLLVFSLKRLRIIASLGTLSAFSCSGQFSQSNNTVTYFKKMSHKFDLIILQRNIHLTTGYNLNENDFYVKKIDQKIKINDQE